jgi:hypothetical protein
VSRIRELYWRADREEEHVLERHNVTREEVEEAIFGDPRGRLRWSGLAKKDPEETVYEYYGRTLDGHDI